MFAKTHRFDIVGRRPLNTGDDKAIRQLAKKQEMQSESLTDVLIFWIAESRNGHGHNRGSAAVKLFGIHRNDRTDNCDAHDIGKWVPSRSASASRESEQRHFGSSGQQRTT